jgi:SAM-dependent methyltransferase
VLDLGCGSGRLFRPLLDGGAASVVGLDGSPALLERARARIARDPVLGSAADSGRLEIGEGDVRTVARRDRFDLVVLAGVIAHLSGPEDALRALTRVRTLLAPGGTLLVDTLGPGGLPPHDLPMSLDWERRIDGRQVVRRSSLTRRETPEGLRVDYRTLTDLTEADGTIARLPASFALWYPEVSVSVALADEADLEVVAAFGSHEEDPLDERSERTILVMRRSTPGRSTE